MLQPFHKLSRMSPPILLCNYILHWGSPRCNPPLISQNGEGKKAPEKRKVVCGQIKEDVLWVHGMEGLWRVGVTLRMMGVLLPRLLWRSRGLRGICLKVKRPYPFWWSSTEKGIFFITARSKGDMCFSVNVNQNPHLQCTRITGSLL